MARDIFAQIRGIVEAVVLSWNSVDLKITVLAKQYDPRGGESLRALMNIDRSEPDSKLFQVPPDYKTVTETGIFTITFKTTDQ